MPTCPHYQQRWDSVWSKFPEMLWNFLKECAFLFFCAGRISKSSWNQEISWKITSLYQEDGRILCWVYHQKICQWLRNSLTITITVSLIIYTVYLLKSHIIPLAVKSIWFSYCHESVSLKTVSTAFSWVFIKSDNLKGQSQLPGVMELHISIV